MDNPDSKFSDFVKSLMEADTLATVPECKGKIYRASLTSFMGEKGDIVDKVVFRPLKRKSCPGCNQCWYLLDDAHEAIACDTFIFPKNPAHGKLYKLKITNISHDYETGSADGWDTTLEPVEE